MLNRLLSGIGLGFFQLAEEVIRKAAHFGEYTGLGILLTLSLTRYGFFTGKKRWRLIPVGFLIACADEGIQYFTPGRACRFTDVLLDTAGVCFGVLLTALFGWVRGRRKKEK